MRLKILSLFLFFLIIIISGCAVKKNLSNQNINNADSSVNDQNNDLNDSLKQKLFPLIKNNNSQNKTFGDFCGNSTYGYCKTDEDCRIGGCSGQICQAKTDEVSATTCEFRACYDSTAYNLNCLCFDNQCQWSN